MRLVFFVALVSCATPAAVSVVTEPAPPLAASAAPSASSAASPAAVRAGCLDVATDIAKRAPGAEPSKTELDFDGDGVSDSIFTSYCSAMGGNCETHLYASNDGCPYYAGTVQVTRVTSGPHCVSPPKARMPCRLSASRMMIHGEIDEYFYEHGAKGYVEAGVGHRGERPPF